MIKWFACLSIVLVVACNQASPTPALPGRLELPTPTVFHPTPSPDIRTSTPFPTQVLVTQNEPEMEVVAELAPTAAPDPLRFVFPTPGRPPESAWRPPLYPIPWAPTPFDHFYFSRPIGADQVNWPLQNYRYGGEFFEDVVHTGVDIPAPTGTPVLAAGSGKVIFSGYGAYRAGLDVLSDPYGIAVIIRHDFGYQGQPLFSLYGHLSETDVVVGQYIGMGEEIGQVGSTGKVTGPHLHFELRLGENNYYTTRNPELWIAPPQGWGVLAGKMIDRFGGLIYKQPFLVISDNTGEYFYGRSYGSSSVNSDEFYNENVVVGDLPAGKYTMQVNYEDIYYSESIDIFPGQVSYFYFWGGSGFEIAPPFPPAAFDPLNTPIP